MNDDLQQSINAALENNVAMPDIAKYLASHENPDYSAYGKSWIESQNAEHTRRSNFEEPTLLSKAQNFAEENPITTAAGATVASSLLVPVAYVAKEKFKTREEIRKAKELAKIESPAVKIQREQLTLGEQKLQLDKQKFQAQQDALIKTENQKAINIGKLDSYSIAKHGYPLATLEEFSKGPLTKQSDIDLVASQFKRNVSPLASPISGTVSNQPAGVPGAVSPMSQLTAQPPAPQLIQPNTNLVNPVAAQIADVQARNQAAEFRAKQLTPVAPPPSPLPSIKDAAATGGNITNAINLNVGNDLDILTKKEQGMKNWLLNQYGGKDLPMAHEAYDQVKQILGYTPAYQEGSRGGSLMPEEKGKILDWRKEALPGPKVNLTHDMKKALKVGGPALAALIATTEFANAKTAEDRANAGTNLLGAILPPGMDINAVGAPGVQQQQINQAALLGSPYAQTEWAKNQRLRERAGAGRGIAPPSAYQR
jgi:hypothetical protein